MSDRAVWNIVGFDDHLDIWIRDVTPDQELIHLVTAWVLSRFDDPYQGVRRAVGFENLWWGHVPLSLRDGEVVVCTYMIHEATRTVKCKSITPMSWPLG